MHRKHPPTEEGMLPLCESEGLAGGGPWWDPGAWGWHQGTPWGQRVQQERGGGVADSPRAPADFCAERASPSEVTVGSQGGHGADCVGLQPLLAQPQSRGAGTDRGSLALSRVLEPEQELTADGGKEGGTLAPRRGASVNGAGTEQALRRACLDGRRKLGAGDGRGRPEQPGRRHRDGPTSSGWHRHQELGASVPRPRREPSRARSLILTVGHSLHGSKLGAGQTAGAQQRARLRFPRSCTAGQQGADRTRGSPLRRGVPGASGRGART